MGMTDFPQITTLADGLRGWTHSFGLFRVKVVVPQGEPMAEIVNFGFDAPYLLVFEEAEATLDQAAAQARQAGLMQIAQAYSTSVVFVYPACEGGWEAADERLFIDLIAQSRINQYHMDGVASPINRFTRQKEEHFIHGAIFRTHLFGRGKAADYIATHCLKTLNGLYLWGPGEITPATATLEGLSVLPDVQRRDIPVVSVGNSDEINARLRESCDHLLVQAQPDIPAAYEGLLKGCKRWCGVLSREATMDEQGMVEERACTVVPTSPDNNGDDKDTAEHAIGYIAFHSKGLLDNGPVPLVLAFHGGGDSALHIAHVSGWWRVAQRNGFLLVCVENHLNSTATETMALLAHLKAKYPIDEKRIYASDFSMGGIKTWDMVQEYPEVFAAVAPMGATVEVGHNVYFRPTEKAINRDKPVPVIYSGGEITPLAELPFQADKCLDRMKYVFALNRVKTPLTVRFEDRESWADPIWGISGDRVERIDDPSRGSVLTINYFVSEDSETRTAFASVSGQGHECREHTCEHAWRFMSRFTR